MSIYSNKSVLSLLNMTREMYKKNIEIRRITKVCATLLMCGISIFDIDRRIIAKCIQSQKPDGGFIGNSDTIWNIKFLEFYPKYSENRDKAINWLMNNNGIEPGFGRSKRDMHRIPVTGLSLFLIPETSNLNTLEWLENTWLSEKNSLTYKAAYVILAFKKSKYEPKSMLIKETANWLVSQQEKSGGFAPWRNHPVGANVFCTAISLLSLISINKKEYVDCIINGYKYLCNSQLYSGIWPYHEIEDGASWGLLALTESEKYLERVL